MRGSVPRGRGAVSGRQAAHLAAHLALAAAMVLLHQLGGARGDRAGDALFLDGGQEPFNSTDPPSPGFIYLTPRKAPEAGSRKTLTPWFEFQESFSIQLWLRPKRIFIGTEVEGGIVGCQVRNTFGNERAGYGLTLTSDSILHFTLTVQTLTATLDHEIAVEEWVHVTLQYDHEEVKASMWYSPGDGKAPKLAATNQFEYDGPKSVNYYIHNDLLIGLFQPLYDSSYYYSGYIDELRFWRRTMDLAEMTDSIYRGYRPDPEYLFDIGMAGYYPMNAVQCTPELCGRVVGMQQWVHVGRNSRFTSSLVLYSSPLDSTDLGADCRSSETADRSACICHEFPAEYCWNKAAETPVYCNTCTENNDENKRSGWGDEKAPYEDCHPVACYGPYGAPKCLQPVLNEGNSTLDTKVVYEIQIDSCIDQNDVQKWTKGYPDTYYQIMNAQQPDMCLTVQQEGPWRGTAVTLQVCTFDMNGTEVSQRAPSYQAWQVDSHTLSLKNELSGFCLSASLIENGAIPYLIDCVTLDILNFKQPVMSFLFDWAAGRSGVMVGGSYLTSDTEPDKCDGANLCIPDVKAPIEQKPKITHVNSEPLVSYNMQMDAFADNPFVVTITAHDPNLNDHIQMDFSPFDVVLQTHESVEWPFAFVCVGGNNDGVNCTCNDYACYGGRGDEYNPLPLETPGGAPDSSTMDQDTLLSLSVCPYGTCRKNPLNSCPSNPCTRTFLWTPIPFTEFINPATLIFFARDIPVNELPGKVSECSFAYHIAR